MYFEIVCDLHLISIFNSPLQGDEKHDKETTLPSTEPLPSEMKGISTDGILVWIE
jgi:hypothetical protein